MKLYRELIKLKKSVKIPKIFMSKNNFEIKVGLAEMLKGGVIMDVQMLTNKIAEDSEPVQLWLLRGSFRYKERWWNS